MVLVFHTGSMDGTARMWNIASGMSLKTFKGHKGAILSLAVDMGNGMLFTGDEMVSMAIKLFHELLRSI